MGKKRWAALWMAGLLLASLASCGGGGGDGSGAGGGSSSSGASGSSSLPEEPSVSAMAPVDLDPLFVDPLTGEAVAAEIGTQRPFAFMMNDLVKALPQVGVSKADVIYEIVAEGGITRMMAVFQELEGVGDLGCIRSARDYYVSLALGHDAVFVHAGGSPQAYDLLQSRSMPYLDFVNGPYGGMCWRDPDRKKSAGLEHSMFTSSEKILEQFPEKFSRTHRDGYLVGWTFSEEAPQGGQPASSLKVTFSSYKTGCFTYDQAAGGYTIVQHISGKDIPYVDGAGGGAVSVSNVLVLYTNVSQVKGDDKGRMDVRTTGSGDGLLLRDGQIYEIAWQRDSENVCYSFLDKQGQPIPLAVGPSYINVIGASDQVEWG